MSAFASVLKYYYCVAFIKIVIQLWRTYSVKYKKRRRVIRLTKCIIVVTLLFTGGSCHERGVINHWGLGISLQRNKVRDSVGWAAEYASRPASNVTLVELT